MCHDHRSQWARGVKGAMWAGLSPVGVSTEEDRLKDCGWWLTWSNQRWQWCVRLGEKLFLSMPISPSPGQYDLCPSKQEQPHTILCHSGASLPGLWGWKAQQRTLFPACQRSREHGKPWQVWWGRCRGARRNYLHKDHPGQWIHAALLYGQMQLHSGHV